MKMVIKMAEYIEREAFIEDIKTEITNLRMDSLKGTPRPHGELYDFIDRINEQPTADVAPVRHGFWVSNIGGTHFCSECGRDALHYQFDELCFREELSDFCPRCGAFLDLEE